MSKKNLSRTVIEGGRYTGNKWDRRNSHAEFRARDKSYISEVKADPENWYDYDVEPTETVYKGFKDKLGPMYRWLHSQVGRLWNEVRSEVSQKFDTRTTAGRHIVYDHLLSSVEVTPDLRYGRYYRGPEDYTQSYYRNDFYVDDDGYLRSKEYIRRKQKIPRIDTNKLANWLNGRVVGYVGDKLFWFVPADKNRKYGGTKRKWAAIWGYPPGSRSYYSRFGLHYVFFTEEPVYKKDAKGQYLYTEKGRLIIESHQQVWREGKPTFRQDSKLSETELKYWNSLPNHYQKVVIRNSPTYVETEEDIAEKKRYYGYLP